MRKPVRIGITGVVANATYTSEPSPELEQLVSKLAEKAYYQTSKPMNKKYVKVLVSERLPEKSGNYFVFISDRDVPNGEFMHTREFNLKENRFTKTPSPVKSFLEEVPDHSEEMLSMLEKSRKMIQSLKLSMLVHPDHEEGSEFDDYTTSAQETEDEIEELINKVKYNGK